MVCDGHNNQCPSGVLGIKCWFRAFVPGEVISDEKPIARVLLQNDI